MNEFLETMFGLEGKVALITGATHGIGMGIAVALGKAGAAVCFNGRYANKNQEALAAYKKQGIEAHGYVCDVTDEKQVAAMIEQIRQEAGPVDILVNNAGLIERKPMLETPVADFQKILDVDLVGPFIMAKAVLPDMIAKNAGKIINICSLMSELGRETISGYAAAKGGLKMLTRNICAEFGSYNIQCNGIGPGYIATSQTAPLRKPQPDGSDSPFDAYIKTRTPAGRWGSPEDLMGTAVFLASRASDYVNGQILYVDGGLLASLGRTPQA